MGLALLYKSNIAPSCRHRHDQHGPLNRGEKSRIVYRCNDNQIYRTVNQIWMLRKQLCVSWCAPNEAYRPAPQMARNLCALVEVGKMVPQRVTQAPELGRSFVCQAELECLASCHGIQRFEATARHHVNFSHRMTHKNHE